MAVQIVVGWWQRRSHLINRWPEKVRRDLESVLACVGWCRDEWQLFDRLVMKTLARAGRSVSGAVACLFNRVLPPGVSPAGRYKMLDCAAGRTGALVERLEGGQPVN